MLGIAMEETKKSWTYALNKALNRHFPDGWPEDIKEPLTDFIQYVARADALYEALEEGRRLRGDDRPESDWNRFLNG